MNNETMRMNNSVNQLNDTPKIKRKKKVIKKC